MGRIALFGSTDITVAVAEAILRAGHAIASITHVPRPFEISYSDKPVAISRQADVGSVVRGARDPGNRICWRRQVGGAFPEQSG